MPIAGLSGHRRLPRADKIRLGEKRTNRNGKEYPVQLDYLKVPDEVAKKYGDRPTEIDIMFASEDNEQIFPQWYKCYGKTGLKCKGDGVNAVMMIKGEMINKPCTPNEGECKKQCKPVATLNVLLPDIPGFGIFAISTSSWNSIVNINSCIDAIRLMTGGRISFIKLKLKYEPHTGTVYDQKKDTQFQKEVYVLSITIDQTIEDFYKRYRLPEPSEIPQLGNAINANSKIKALLESKNEIPLDGEDFIEYEEEHEDDGPPLHYCEECTLEITDYTDKNNITKTAEEIAEYTKTTFGAELCAECLIKRVKPDKQS